MDLMPGGSLRARLRERGRLDGREAVTIALALARALARCHAAGVVHRDVKPDNVLFDDEGRPRLSDFGVVRDLHASVLTETGGALGTPAYMAPEQLDGARVDGRADVYATGVLLHELVTGERPFQATVSVLAMLREKREGRRPLLAVAGVPPGLDHVLDRALAPRPEDRTEGALELAGELEPLLEWNPLAPKAPASRSRGALLLFALLAAGGAGLFAVAWRATTPPEAAADLDSGASSSAARWSEERWKSTLERAAGLDRRALDELAALGSGLPARSRTAVVASAVAALERHSERFDPKLPGALPILEDLRDSWRRVQRLDGRAGSQRLTGRVKDWISTMTTMPKPPENSPDHDKRVVEIAGTYVCLAELFAEELEPQDRTKLLWNACNALVNCQSFLDRAAATELLQRFEVVSRGSAEGKLALGNYFAGREHDRVRAVAAYQEAVARVTSDTLGEVLEALALRAAEGHLGHEDWSKALEPLRGTAVVGRVPDELCRIGQNFAQRGWLDVAYDHFEEAARSLGPDRVPWRALAYDGFKSYEGTEYWRRVVDRRPDGIRDLLLLARARARCKDVYKRTENPKYTHDWFSLIAAWPEGACLREVAPRVAPFPQGAKEWKDLSEELDAILRRRLAEVR
jgi:serine/threonine protein kinase